MWWQLIALGIAAAQYEKAKKAQSSTSTSSVAGNTQLTDIKVNIPPGEAMNQGLPGQGLPGSFPNPDTRPNSWPGLSNNNTDVGFILRPPPPENAPPPWTQIVTSLPPTMVATLSPSAVSQVAADGVNPGPIPTGRGAPLGFTEIAPGISVPTASLAAGQVPGITGPGDTAFTGTGRGAPM